MLSSVRDYKTIPIGTDVNKISLLSFENNNLLFCHLYFISSIIFL